MTIQTSSLDLTRLTYSTEIACIELGRRRRTCNFCNHAIVHTQGGVLDLFSEPNAHVSRLKAYILYQHFRRSKGFFVAQIPSSAMDRRMLFMYFGVLVHGHSSSEEAIVVEWALYTTCTFLYPASKDDISYYITFCPHA
jgi:hypothetical protein